MWRDSDTNTGSPLDIHIPRLLAHSHNAQAHRVLEHLQRPRPPQLYLHPRLLPPNLLNIRLRQHRNRVELLRSKLLPRSILALPA